MIWIFDAWGIYTLLPAREHDLLSAFRALVRLITDNVRLISDGKSGSYSLFPYSRERAV
jgi:hypothetical protein